MEAKRRSTERAVGDKHIFRGPIHEHGLFAAPGFEADGIVAGVQVQLSMSTSAQESMSMPSRRPVIVTLRMSTLEQQVGCVAQLPPCVTVKPSQRTPLQPTGSNTDGAARILGRGDYRISLDNTGADNGDVIGIGGVNQAARPGSHRPSHRTGIKG